MRTATLEQPLDRRKSQTFPPSEKTTTTREPFAALPHSIAGRPDITPTEKAVLLALLFWSRAKAVCWPSDASIGARIGRSVGTVQRALRRLEALGLIVRQKTADNPTGRLIVLVWVAERLRSAPPSPALEPPAPPARDEGRREREQERPVAGAGRERPPLPAGEPEEEPDRATLHQWAEGPDPILRRIARARLAELDQLAPAPSCQAIKRIDEAQYLVYHTGVDNSSSAVGPQQEFSHGLCAPVRPLSSHLWPVARDLLPDTGQPDRPLRLHVARSVPDRAGLLPGPDARPGCTHTDRA